MKKIYIFLVAALAWSAVRAEDNTLYFTDAAIMPGQTGSIQLCMKNVRTDLTCLEAEIQLPEGLSVVQDDAGNPVVTQIHNRSSVHELLANVLESGNLKVLISSADADLFGEGDGPLLSFRVQADEDVLPGNYEVKTVGESLLVNDVAEAFYSVGVTGNVLVTDDPTGINDELRMKDEESGAIYNLAGQRVGKANLHQER